MTFNRLHLIRQVDLFSLRLFLSAVEEEQIGRAAIREHISASTATKRIQDLEEIVGQALLARTPKGVTATPAGEALARCIHSIFSSLEEFRSEIAEFSDGIRGEVVVASMRTIISPFLARELGDFSRDFPLVELLVSEMQNVDIVPAVVRGDADVGVFAAANGIDLSGVNRVSYRKDRLVAVVPRRSALAERTSVTFANLLAENVIPATSLVSLFAAAAKRAGSEFVPKYSVLSSGVAISLVRAGLGVTIQPESAVAPEALADVAMIDLSEPWAVRMISIATAKGRSLNPAARALISQLLDRPTA